MDQKEFEAWLNTRPREDAILIAQRAALLVFPLWAEQIGKDWALERNLTSLLLLRNLLTSGVVRNYPTPEIEQAAALAANASSALVSDTSALAAADASNVAAAASAALVAGIAALAIADAPILAAAASALTGPRFAFWSNTEQDVAMLQSGGVLLSTPLWHSDLPAVWQESEPQALQNLTRETGDPNSFWHRWWRGAVSGQWLDWNLQRDIALIPDDIWQQGPKAVMAAIAEIEARHDLLRQVTDLRQQVEVLQEMVRAPGAAVAHRGHNHPPELVDLPAAIAEHAAPLLPQLQQAEAELVKPQPNRAVLRKLAGALATFAGAVLRYCGKTADTIVQEGAKVLAIYLAVNPDAVGRVVDGASALAKALTQYLTTFGP